MKAVDVTWDAETNNLLNDESIDYTQSPYKLKDSYKVHCLVLERHDTKEIIAFYNGGKYVLDGKEYIETYDGVTYTLKDYDCIEYTHYQLDEFPDYIANLNLGKVVGHNTINFDHLVCKLYFNMDYTVGHSMDDVDTWHGQEVDITDTMVLSKVLNPDRFGGHSLGNIASMAKKTQKMEFRYNIHQSKRFDTFAADMLYYNIKDVQSNTDVYSYLEWEKTIDDWGSKWDKAIRLEKKVAEIITRQSHTGFLFDQKLAEQCVEELDALMDDRRQRVEPLLPMRKGTKKFIGEHTPPKSQISEKEIPFPKKFFNKKLDVTKGGESWLEKWGASYDEDTGTISIASRGVTLHQDYKLEEEDSYSFPPVAFIDKNLTSYIKNFTEKHGGTYDEVALTLNIFGKEIKLPFDQPLKTMMVAEIGDTTHIKDWLVGLGWKPSEYKIKDITLKSGTKIKRDVDDLEKAVDRYVAETLDCAFKADRCKHMKAKPNAASLKRKIMDKASKYGCKVLTNPSFTVGQDKELCTDLERIAEAFPYVMDVVEYLTYKHRRNSILGGGLDWEEGEEAEKGYMANIRADGRISTPADTLGAVSGRMRHKIVTNVPRVTSLYGSQMRSLFKVAKDCFKIGADFDSLEARGEGHYCYKYDEEDKAYCKSLTLPKPNDVHSVMSRNISKILGKEFGRSPAKSVKYGLTFGAMAAKISTMINVDLKTGEGIVEAFWQAALPLALLKKAVETWWENKGNSKFIVGLDGRKVHTRFKHALLNSLFQSFGAISAKTMVVFYDKLLLDEELQVDFFKDDWANMERNQLMIVMHDEVALEESKTRFKFKKFDTQEEALEFSEKDSKVWSEPIEKKGKFYLGYSRAGELISKAVEMTNKHFKLRVELTMGYVIGRNWSETH
jgi:hypothetical protein